MMPSAPPSMTVPGVHYASSTGAVSPQAAAAAAAAAQYYRGAAPGP